MKRIKTAVVGLGMGLNFHIPQVAAHPGFELTAICDIDREKLAPVCTQYGVRGYIDYAEMLVHESLDLVVLASPTTLHAEQAIAALERGIDVFLEKPMATSYTEACRVAEVMRRAGGKLMVYQPHRTFSDDLAVQDVLRSGVLGRVYLIKRRASCLFVRTNWQAYICNGGGSLFNHGAHYVDELLYLSGGEPEQVSCMLARVLATGDADDYFKALIRTDSGVLLDAEMSMSSCFRCVPWELYGDRGSCVYTKDAAGRHILRARYFTGNAFEPSKYLPTVDVTQSDAELPWVVRDFAVDDYPAIRVYDKCYEYYAEGKPPFVPVEETLVVMRTLERCREAAGMIV